MKKVLLILLCSINLLSSGLAYEKISEISKQKLIALNLKGEALYSKRKYKDALFNFNIVLDNDPKNIRALRKKTITLIHLNFFEEAVNTGISALKYEDSENPVDTGQLLFNIALSYQKMGNIHNAKLFYFFEEKVYPSKAAEEKLQSLKIENINVKPVKVLWNEAIYDPKLNDKTGTLLLNENYLKTIPEYIRAILGYYGYFYGNECWWDGPYKEDSELLPFSCTILITS